MARITQLETAHGRFDFTAGDRIQFTGTDKKAGIINGAAGTIEAIDGTHVAVRLDGRDGEDDQLRRRELRQIPPRLCRHDLQRAGAHARSNLSLSFRSTGAARRATSR